MTTRSNQTRISLGGLRWLVPLSLSLALAGSAVAADPCSSKTYELNVPDPATLHLKDGEHTIASVNTDQGKFEARVRVKGGVVSDDGFWANGKRLKEGRESDLKPELLKCLKAQKASLSSSEGWIASAAQFASSLVEHSAEAKLSHCLLKVTATCYQHSPGHYFCAYRVCCGSVCHIEFDPLPK